ncbi:zinc-binding alcohol dehydrogenase family protein [Phototrophicus methaneseepsis]|uniref:Zinc-binding alcohol dehydrogenase family protein n=1 Tax=Phototrophicus methaneseepsis TaxID=2710758 RepID=A0A7S8IFX6_9CHLR|nr:zinc-binding alcohol dehydrogenase family protein [Phototrophicus methaneseepsis]QPC84076.1 zinc-binding alcohol dehydrogenase family protein [Phototrophicus methaneseepsis]
MKTLVLQEPGHFILTDTDAPQSPAPGEALVRVVRVGICGTDLHAFEGTQPFFDYPRILGHELAVEIVAINGETPLSVGDICAVRPYMNCGECIACRQGKTNCCENLQVIGVHYDGGMREQIIVPLDKLHPTPGLPVEQVALVETLSIGAHAVRRAQLQTGEHTLVIGAGPIGLGVAQFARAAGAHVIVMDINPDRLAFCRDGLGFEHTIDARHSPEEQLRALCDGDLPTAVFDATGSSKSMHQAFMYVAHGGRLIFVGLFKGEISFSDPYFHSHEMTILSSRNATAADFEWVIEALTNGDVSLAGWITHQATPEELVTVFPGWLNPEAGVIKAMLTLESRVR